MESISRLGGWESYRLESAEQIQRGGVGWCALRLAPLRVGGGSAVIAATAYGPFTMSPSAGCGNCRFSARRWSCWFHACGCSAGTVARAVALRPGHGSPGSRVRVDQANALREDRRAGQVVRSARWLCCATAAPCSRTAASRCRSCSTPIARCLWWLRDELKVLWTYRYAAYAEKLWQ